jgi:hypothetical protein
MVTLPLGDVPVAVTDELTKSWIRQETARWLIATTVAVGYRSAELHSYDGLIENDVACQALEMCSGSEGEHTAVGCHEVVAVAGGCCGDAHDRLVESPRSQNVSNCVSNGNGSC